MPIHQPGPFASRAVLAGRARRRTATHLMSATVSAVMSVVLMFALANGVAAATVDATSATAAAPSENKIVKIDNFSFSPARLEVTAGSTVTWENHDDMPHTVVHSTQPADFSSPPLDTDEKFSYRFTKPGTYAYFCSMHPRMTGTIIVK